MEIRKSHPKDKAELIELLHLNTPQYFSPKEEKDLIHYLDNDADNHFVLIVDDKIVGTGGFIVSKDKTTGMLSWDFFHPDHQGKELGTILTRFRIERMKEIKSVKNITVRTSQFTYKFYEKFGLEVQEIVVDYWDKGYDLYSMSNSVDKVK